MNLLFTITELSNMTGKTRPTLYKYVSAYEAESFDEVPFSFIQLFNLLNKPNVNRKEVIDYCDANFKSVSSDIKINEIVSLIKNNKSKIDLDNLKKHIEEEILKWVTLC